MSFTGSFIFDFFDVRDNRLGQQEVLTIQFRHSILQSQSHRFTHRGHQAMQTPLLESVHEGRYQVTITPTNYHPISLFLQVREGRTVRHPFTLPVNPHRVDGVRFPSFATLPASLQTLHHQSTTSGHDGATRYDRLAELPKAGLLNIHAKMRNTMLPDQRTAASLLGSLIEIRRDRFFAHVDPELFLGMRNGADQGLFDAVSDVRHNPPEGFEEFERAGGFKTFDRYGNLNLSFFQHPVTEKFIVDADLDESSGLEHLFDVIRHDTTGEQTHPYDIHQILLAHQGIEPGYDLIV